MPRLFVYEYASAMSLPGPASLHSEGWAMLSAVLRDLDGIDGMSLTTFLSKNTLGVRACCLQVSPENEELMFRREAAAADFTLVIAPEFDDILRTRCRWVEEAGGRLLGPSSAAVRLTGDKLALAHHLTGGGVPTPECCSWQLRDPVPALRFPAVLKPLCGAGSQATFLVNHPHELATLSVAAQAEGWTDAALLQSFVAGEAVSVAFLIGPAQCLPLLPAAQRLSTDGRFRYLGGTLPLAPALAERAVQLARQAIDVVPGLSGYVGVDLVLGARDDWVIEINPRLTTSYVGLRVLAEGNLMDAMLRGVRGESSPRLSWRSARVQFEADGSWRSV